MPTDADSATNNDPATNHNSAPCSENDGLLPPAPREIPTRVAKGVAEIMAACDLGIEGLPLELPQVTGYEVLGPIGFGGMGIVYKARQVKADRIVALKMIRSGWHTEPQLRARFRTEIETVASLGHPNIVQVYEVGEQNGYDFFSMEFMPGGRLDEKVAAAPQAAREAAQLVAQLADAIHFAHVRRVIHRDLKPSNILLSGDGAPKIADFGLAKRLELETGATTAGEPIGTPCYMAPEQAAGKVGPASDIYSLGAILYELLTGRPPHHGVTTMDTLQQVMNVDPVPPSRLQPNVPRDLETICLKCLQKQPHHRYADAGRLADDLRRFIAGEPIAARPIRFWERGLKWARRQPAWAALIMVSTLATLGFAGAGWWSSATFKALSLDLKIEAARARLQARSAERAHQESKRREEQAIQAGLEADEQRRQADQQRQLADANLRQAGEVLDQFVRISQDPRLRTEELRGVRQKMQKTALAFYERLVQQRSDDPEVLAEQGRTLRRIARITYQTGNKSEAAKLSEQSVAVFDDLVRARANQSAYARELALSLYDQAVMLNDVDRRQSVVPFRRAVAIQEKLQRENPHDTAYLRDLATTYYSLGGVLTDLFEFDQANPVIEQALESWQTLLKEDPQHTAYRRAVAATHMVIGRFYRYHDEPAQRQQAEHSYRQALDIRLAMHQEDPQDLGLQSDVADSHFWLGGLYYLTDDLDQAERHLQAALGLRQRLHSARPQYTLYSVELGRILAYLGNIARDGGQLEQSLEHYTQAIGLLKSASDKEHRRATSFLASAKLDHAEALTRLGKHEQGQAEWSQACELDTSVFWRNSLARAEKLARAGDHLLASGKAFLLAKERSISSGRRFALAAVYALSAAAAHKDRQLDPAQREKLAADYAARAVALLAKAYANGYFQKAENLQRLKSDRRLDPLRAEEEFQKLLSEPAPQGT